MNKDIHLDLDTWIVPGQIRKANLYRGLGNSYKPAGTEVLISLSLSHLSYIISLPYLKIINVNASTLSAAYATLPYRYTGTHIWRG